jgi:hypothetical protein
MTASPNAGGTPGTATPCEDVTPWTARPLVKWPSPPETPSARPPLNPMGGADPMHAPTREEVALSATDAVRTTAPEDRSRFVAALAFRLAELGHAKEVRVLVAGTVEACQAVRSFLADWRTGGSQAARDDPGRDGAGPDGSEAVSSSSDAPASVLKRTAACLACGRGFSVNPCHAKTHRFCSGACRARWHRQPGPHGASGAVAPLVAVLRPCARARLQDQRLAGWPSFGRRAPPRWPADRF